MRLDHGVDSIREEDKHTDHGRAAIGIHGKVFAGNNPAHAGSAKGLLMDLLELILVNVILQNDNAPGIGADDSVIWIRLETSRSYRAGL